MSAIDDPKGFIESFLAASVQQRTDAELRRKQRIEAAEVVKGSPLTMLERSQAAWGGN